MPRPDTSLSTLRPELVGSMEEFNLAMDRRGFIGNRVMPVIEVGKASGDFGIIPIEQLLQEPLIERAAGANYSRINYTFTKTSFATQEYGVEIPVDSRDAEIYSEYIDAELVAADIARDVVLRQYEKRIADLVFDSSDIDASITNEWDDSSNATPIADVETAVQALWDNTGLRANALVMSWKVARNLRNVDEVIDRIKYVKGALPQQITLVDLSQAFDLPYILIGGGARNSADEGQSVSVGEIWSGEYVAIMKIAETNSIKEPAYGRTFHWGSDGSTMGGTMESYYSDERRAEIIRARMETDELEIYASCRYLYDNATT